MSAARKRFYDFVAAQPCIRCFRTGVEVAHIRAMLSPKTGQLMGRSHVGLPAWACLPLCSECHRTAPDSLHNVGEAQFFAALGKGESWRFQYLASLLAQFAGAR